MKWKRIWKQKGIQKDRQREIQDKKTGRERESQRVYDRYTGAEGKRLGLLRLWRKI